MVESKIPLVVVIPVYNEAGCLVKVIEDWLSEIRVVPNSRLLIVDDGSTDNTPAIINGSVEKFPNIKSVRQNNCGHGAAIMNGYQAALAMGPEWVFQVDSDDQIEAHAFQELWDSRNQSPFILGIRKHRQDPWYRLITSLFDKIHLLVLFQVWIGDPNIPFRLMKSSILSEFLTKFHAGVFAPNIFLSVLAKKAGIDTMDIPVPHKIRASGTPSLNFRKWFHACFRCLKELAYFRIHLSRLKKNEG